MTSKTKKIRQELEDVEWYSPTVPMSWQRYHEIIRELCDTIDANQSKRSVSIEISSEDDAEDVQHSFVNGLKELGLKVKEDWDGDQDSPTTFIVELAKGALK